MNANAYIADELSNRMRYFSQELQKAQKLIEVLEAENHSLKGIVSDLSYSGDIANDGWDTQSYADII